MKRVAFGEPLFRGGEQPPLCLTGARLAQLAHVTCLAATTYTFDALLRCEPSARPAAPPRPLLAPDSQTLGPREPSRLARWFGMDPGNGKSDVGQTCCGAAPTGQKPYFCRLSVNAFSPPSWPAPQNLTQAL